MYGVIVIIHSFIHIIITVAIGKSRPIVDFPRQSYIPFFGAIISGAFACLIALGSGGLTSAVIALLVVLVIQNVLQAVINAKFMGDSLNLHPIVVLAVTIVGSIFGGLLGTTLAAPALAMVLRARKRLVEAKEEAAKAAPDESIVVVE